MPIGVTVEVRSALGTVSFQSQVPVAPESLRCIKKELSPGETWSWPLLPLSHDRIAVFAAQSMLPGTLLINGTETLLEGQTTTDFGVVFGRRRDEAFGTLPFTGDLSLIQVTNLTDKKNRIDIMLGEVPPDVINSLVNSEHLAETVQEKTLLRSPA